MYVLSVHDRYASFMTFVCGSAVPFPSSPGMCFMLAKLMLVISVHNNYSNQAIDTCVHSDHFIFQIDCSMTMVMYKSFLFDIPFSS